MVQVCAGKKVEVALFLFFIERNQQQSEILAQAALDELPRAFEQAFKGHLHEWCPPYNNHNTSADLFLDLFLSWAQAS